MSDNNFRKGPHASKNKRAAGIENPIEGIVPESDERKTVVLDEDLEGVEFEDRVWLYWKRNKTFLLTSIALAFAVVIGVQSYKMYRAKARSDLAAAYCAAATPEQLAQFAAKNSGKALAGVALLQNGDTFYSEGKFAEAQKAYDAAAKPLAGTELEGRALIGAAACVCAQDASKGAEAFKAVFENKNIDAAYSAQAGYLFGLACRKVGKTAEAKDAFKKVSQDAAAGFFGQLAQDALSKM